MRVLAVHDVARPAEQLANVELKTGVLKDPYGSLRVEVHEHINIAVNASHSTGHGPEHGSMAHPALAQLGLVRL